LKVLVVDDNCDAASTLSMLLEMVGHEVRIAFDGIEALAVAARFFPNVVLLDLGMPGMDGLETCRRLREQSWGEKMAVIAVTGWGTDSDRGRTKEAGFDQHLVKPVEPDVILGLLAGLAH
jgi:DNA-binding response OmpR family regulator